MYRALPTRATYAQGLVLKQRQKVTQEYPIPSNASYPEGWGDIPKVESQFSNLQ